jgi:hypothetical protein
MTKATITSFGSFKPLLPDSAETTCTGACGSSRRCLPPPRLRVSPATMRQDKTEALIGARSKGRSTEYGPLLHVGERSGGCGRRGERRTNRPALVCVLPHCLAWTTASKRRRSTFAEIGSRTNFSAVRSRCSCSIRIRKCRTCPWRAAKQTTSQHTSRKWRKHDSGQRPRVSHFQSPSCPRIAPPLANGSEARHGTVIDGDHASAKGRKTPRP